MGPNRFDFHLNILRKQKLIIANLKWVVEDLHANAVINIMIIHIGTNIEY